MRIIFILTSILISFNLTQCVSYDFSRRIVQQGNLLPKEKIDRLKTGMTRNDVTTLMGTSLISPTFNNDRWDYAYTRRRGSNAIEIRHVSLFFKGNTLVQIEHKP